MIVPGIQDAAKIPELRKRVLFTLGMLIIYRIGVFVPTPGIDAQKLRALFEQASSTLFGLVNMFSGGAVENFSVLALGIGPYISVSIVMHMMTAVVPRLEELSKEGAAGRRVITRYTRIGTVILALVQGTLLSFVLESQGVVANPGIWFRFVTAITLTGGASFIMWLGEQITERGLGNGISLIITAGILARMPTTLFQTLALMRAGEIPPFNMLFILAFAVATIALIVWVERAQRRIPVQYPRRASAGKMATSMTQHLPLKVNSAGVIPPIFASMAILFVTQALGWIDNDQVQQFVAFLQPTHIVYNLLFAGMIIFFCYFYTALVVEPEKMAENLKSAGGFVPGVRPGKETAEYLSTVLSRLTFWGSLYVTLICIAPTLFYIYMGAEAFSYFFGGTAVLIIVVVLLDTVSQMESHLVARNYESFMKKGPGKIRGASRASHIKGRLIQR